VYTKCKLLGYNQWYTVKLPVNYNTLCHCVVSRQNEKITHMNACTPSPPHTHKVTFYRHGSLAHLKILDARQLAQSKSHTDYPQIKHHCTKFGCHAT
jgi:hypothetical protein